MKKDKLDTLIKLKLYVVKNSQSSSKAMLDIKNFLDTHYKDQYDLEVINILDEPVQAEQDNIMVTPTLLKTFPAPSKRIIGDLGDDIRIRFGLGIENNHNFH